METTRSITIITSAGAPGTVQEQPQKDTQPKQPLVEQVNVQEVVKQLSEAISTNNMHLSFSVDGSSGKVVVRVTDEKTGQLVRQIPSDDVLRIAKNIRAMLGILYDHSV
jgi:flagellar protein FlaG